MDELTGGTPDTSAADAGAAPAGSFADDLRAETPSFTQADLDAKIAESQAKWQTEQDAKFGWAKDLTAEQYQAQAALAARHANDPIGLARELMASARSDPRFAPTIQGLIHQTLASGPGAQSPAQPATPSPAPGPDLRVQNPDGSITQMYSAERMAEYAAWLEQKFDAKMGQTIKPLSDFHQQSVAEREAAEARQAQWDRASAVTADVQKQPGFAEHKDAIIAAYKKEIATMPVEGRSEFADVSALWRAYTSVVLAHTTTEKQTEALTQQALKASAGTARPMGHQRPSTPVKDEDRPLRDLIKEESQRFSRKTG